MTASPLRPGLRLRSRTCTTEVIVIRPGTAQGAVQCGGMPMAGGDDPSPAVPAAAAPPSDGVLLGKRYTDETRTLELLCTKAGIGPLTLDGAVLTIKAAKPLPASD